MPDSFLRGKCAKIGISLPPEGQYAMGMVFLPQDASARISCERIFERITRDYDMKVLGWRDVPVTDPAWSPTIARMECAFWPKRTPSWVIEP